jgi:4-hydroxy-tetrahydrodipicolinate synthase
MTVNFLPPGIYPYLVSPIADDGAVRESVLARLVDDLVAAGVNGITPLGSTGEVSFLTPRQRRRIVEVALEACHGRVPVVPGIAAFSNRDAVEQARSYAELGATGLVVMRQNGGPVSADAMYRYFAEVAQAVEIPIVLYTNPSVLGTDFSIDTLERLVELPNVRYIKDATSDTGRILSYTNRFGDRLKVFSASAHIPLVVFLLGGIGWMSGPACAYPRAALKLYELVQRGQLDRAMMLQRATWPLNEAFRSHPLGACIKAALACRGYEVGSPVEPQEPLAANAVEQIGRALATADQALSELGEG